ncbi:MAG: transketolase [Candidatus Woesearchaeota archaeon]|jgi:transketolase|nr:transketolase [Candidatus Woesearchaeota archaeon]
MNKEKILELKKIANDIRKESIIMIHRAQSGHPGGSLSEADLLSALYFYKLKLNTKKPHDKNRDRLVLSKGHASPAFYAALAMKGFFDKKELESFRKINSMLQGHPELKTPGVDFAGGSLGQGVCFANGLAIAGKLDNKDYKVYAIIGDGEAQEGAVWEAAMAASHHKLDNLVVILDKNQIQETGFTKDVMNIDPAADKWKAFGFNTIEIDGHNMEEIVNALDEADKVKGKPTMIIANTIKGKGVSFMELNHKFHGKAPDDKQYKKAIEELEAIDKTLQ